MAYESAQVAPDTRRARQRLMPRSTILSTTLAWCYSGHE